jgi:zinc protease
LQKTYLKITFLVYLFMIHFKSNMQKTLIITLLFFSCTNQLPSQNEANQKSKVPIASPAPKNKYVEIDIPYEKHQLSNGLTVLIHEDHSDPVVYVDVTYHVGSAREQQGRSGFAHFFEHMMFQGSKHVGDDQHFKVVTDAGGILNGTTNSDRTNYFETVPINQLEKMLWLEADRMGFLLDSVTQKKFEVQRATVKNERGQRYDNAPYGLVGEKIGEALYPQGHPYSWTTIGYIDDLNRVDVNDLKRFYMRWYGPNNAVLTVAGNVNSENVLKLAEKYFGNIQKCPNVSPQKIEPFKLASNRYISYEDNVNFPSINYVYPTVDIKNKDAVALDVLSTILSGSQGSPFYKAFIESGKAVSVNSYQNSRELAGQFQLTIRANATSSLTEIDKEVKVVFAKWEKKGVTDDDLIKFKAKYQSNLYNRLSTVQGKGALLASNYTLMGNADYFKKDIEHYMSVTKADVMRVYNTYIKNKAAVILSCLPKGKGDLRVQPDNWKMYDRIVEKESDEYKNLVYNEPKDVEGFNRFEMPRVPDFKEGKFLNFFRLKVADKIGTIVYRDTETPKVNILITFKAGHRFESKEKSGVAELTASMLGKSTLKTKAAEIENKLDRLGSSISITSGDEDFSINVQCLKKNYSNTLKILQESLLEPMFDSVEFENEKKQQLDRITQAQTNAGAIADNTFRKVLYGEEQVMSYPTIGKLETVKNITLKDIKEYHKKLNINSAKIAIVGDVNKTEILTELAFLSKFRSDTVPEFIQTEPAKIEKTKIYFVDKKNAAQSEIRIGCFARPYDVLGSFYRCVIANFSFAGSFNSRVNYLLREVKGWTYGTRGIFSGNKYDGTYLITGGFKSNATDSAIIEIFKELKKYATDGITDEELTFTKNAMLQSEALKSESPTQKLYILKRILDYKLQRDYTVHQAEILRDFEKNQIRQILDNFFPYNNMAVVVVGDKASNFEKIKKLGYDVIEMDVNGKLIN